MRLFEFAGRSKILEGSENILSSILQNLRLDIIRGLKDRPGQEDPPPISYATLINMVKSGGAPHFTQQELEASLNTPQIQELINSVSDGMITLKLPETEPATIEQPSQIPPEKKVEMMAQRAMSRRQ